jgi:glucokinase
VTYYLGIDIGGTKIAAGVVDNTGAVTGVFTQPTDAARGRDHVLSVALALAEERLRVRPAIAAIGVGSGGQIDSERGVVVSATEILPGWTGTDLRAVFQDRFSRPVSVDNDVNALAVGEHRFGAAKGASCALFLALGTGVGGAILIDGRIHHGAHWTGGELGHLIIDTREVARRDPGGARGTLEAYCSGGGLVATWCELGGVNETLTGRDIARLAVENRDPRALHAIQQTGEYLGWGLVSLANIFDPDIIVIGGGMASLGDILLDPAREILRTNALPGPASCPVAVASLGEHAAVIGAASLAMPKPVK